MSTGADPSRAPSYDLTDRERDILRLVVKSFVETAGPIGSRSLARQYPSVGLSPASIRNTMSDLEEMGFLGHPYTSAGRVPTERGYRAFVDELMGRPELSLDEKIVLKQQLDERLSDVEDLLRESSRLLGQLTNLLGLVLSPRLSTGVLERLEIVPLSGQRLMFVLSVRGGLVKTIVLEFDAEVKRSALDRVVGILNERLAGLTLRELRRTCAERVRDLDDEPTGIVRFVLGESRALFSEPSEGRLRFGSAQNLLHQPEFQEPDDLRHLIEVMEDEDLVVRVLEDLSEHCPPGVGRALVSIGSESSAEAVERYSIVTSPYQLSGTVGALGVIGPTRMDYARVVALVESVAALINQPEA